MTVRETREYRRDVEGLRAVAILAVVLFHAGVSGLGGGFVGVDVFFVISGFLITGILRREVESSGRVRLLQFWSRRVKRLVPALTVVVALTLAASVVIYSALEWKRLALEAVSSATYWSNLLFARQSTQYFAPQIDGSPFLQTWSLGVEEQFYLVWPLLVVVAAVVARNRWPFRRVFGLVLAGAAITSFALSLVLTTRAPAWAFFSSPTRGWEFALGGLLAVVGVVPLRGSSWGREALTLLGLGLIGVAVLLLTERTPYPGVAAVVPVAGTMAVLAAGSGSTTRVGSALGCRPLAFVGRVSYSWYLLHWPAVVLTLKLVPSAGVAMKLAACVVALGLAEVLHRVVENPIRFAPRLAQRPGLALGLGAAFTLVVVAGALVVRVGANHELADPRYQALAAARQDYQSYSVGERCEVRTTVGGIEACVGGDPNAERTVLLAGDSHAEQWAPALDAAARELGVRLLVRTRGACPALATPVLAQEGRGASEACAAFVGDTGGLIEQASPAAVITSSAPYRGRLVTRSGGVLDEDDARTAWRGAQAQFAEAMRRDGVAYGLILDTPSLPEDPIECLARRGGSADGACTYPADISGDARSDARSAGLAAIAEAGYGTTLDPTELVCPGGTCVAERDQVVTFKDSNHITKAQALLQRTRLQEWLASLL